MKEEYLELTKNEKKGITFNVEREGFNKGSDKINFGITGGMAKRKELILNVGFNQGKILGTEEGGEDGITLNLRRVVGFNKGSDDECEEGLNEGYELGYIKASDDSSKMRDDGFNEGVLNLDLSKGSRDDSAEGKDDAFNDGIELGTDVGLKDGRILGTAEG